MKKIPVQQGKYYALVDDQDYEPIARYKWQANIRPTGKVYAERTLRIRGKPDTRILMHRVIMKTPKGVQVDHINGNGLDNRRSNLRHCSGFENQRNRGLNRNNKCGYKGVSRRFDMSSKRLWRARITYNNKELHLGVFSTPEEAARAYNAKAKELYGEFAWLNPV